MNKDTLTTVVGAVGAVTMAINPALTAMSANQSLHWSDYSQLVIAAVLAILGFFSNKKKWRTKMLQSHQCAGCAGYNNALDCAKVKDCRLDKTSDTSKIDVSEKESVVSVINRVVGISS